MKKIRLKNNISLPVLGLGTWELIGKECFETVKTALKIGYRHIDTADAYGNHEHIANALYDSDVSRKEVFITTKVWRENLNKNELISSAERFLKELRTDYLDLLLIHWPNQETKITETLAALEELREKKVIRAFGAANFTTNHLQDCLKTGADLAVNQIEFHPSFKQWELKKFCDQHKINITAYSPFGRGQDLLLPEIMKIATKYNKPSSQVIINWLIQNNIIVIPKATSETHLRENFEALQWKLAKDDLEKIDKIKNQERLLNPSFAEFNY